MTSTRVKDGTVTFTLSTSLVEKGVKSYTMSRRYINTMLKITSINILYHRLKIDEKEFITKVFHDIPYKFYRFRGSKQTKDANIRQYHAVMEAAKDAIAKNYLTNLHLFLVNRENGDIIENYKFTFKYSNKESEETQGGEALMECTHDLLRTLQDFKNWDKLEEDVIFKAEFTYNDDVPEEYVPPGFTDINQNDSLLIKARAKKGNSVILGDLFTGFHHMKCSGKGKVFDLTQDSSSVGEVLEVEALPSTSAAVDDVYTDDEAIEVDLDKSRDAASAVSINTSVGCRLNDTYLSNIIEIRSNADDDEVEELQCPCKLSEYDKFLSLDSSKCTACKRVYHSPCQGYLDNSFISSKFKCSYCKKEEDSIVALFDVAQSISIFRQRLFLACIYKYRQIPTKLINDFKLTMQTFNRFKIFEIKGPEVILINHKLLLKLYHDLFKFDLKELDEEKLCQISSIATINW